MAAASPYVAIIIWNVNGLNSPIKDRMAEWVKKIRSNFMLTKKLHLSLRTQKQKVKGCKKNSVQVLRISVDIPVPYKIDFKCKAMKKYKESHQIIVN